MPELTEWDGFYVIVASAAGALIGLQFVVMTLIATQPLKGAEAAGAAFATPTLVHFSASLLIPIRRVWRIGCFMSHCLQPRTSSSQRRLSPAHPRQYTRCAVRCSRRPA